MAITNQQRVGAALELLRSGLAPYVEREFKAAKAKGSGEQTFQMVATDPLVKGKSVAQWDVALLLKLMWEAWNEVFRETLGQAERNLVSELRTCRNKWAHQDPFSSRDAERALDSMSRLLSAISAPQADEIDKMMYELRRLTIDEQVRGEKRKVGGSLIESAAAATLKPWREVVHPHPDVQSGGYQQAEFAADLWQVHLGEGSPEYRDPAEFFRRTYLTDSLKKLLVSGIQRINGGGGDPVVQLQTNFGGGKTHSMLALYHLFSGAAAGDLLGVDEVMADADVKQLRRAKRVVLVGNKISPGNPTKKPDGTVVRTLWGELAYQLGGKEAYARIKADDERATNPGDVLRELFNKYGPCLILIDEWVAYARQLKDQGDWPGGSFETQFTFAQALTESAKLASNCLLVISLPASDTTGSPHAVADDVEVGGERGRAALDRLRNVVGRLESSWRPATAEEGFEIVRRRLFEPLQGDRSKYRNVTARAFYDLYQDQKAEFPLDCANPDYERRIQDAYPIHPEIFDRLYSDWSTLVKFQRTRGVLRLMAAVIHCLWEKGDKNPLILPSTLPIDEPRVQNELTRYLSDNWAPIIEKDVDGPNSLPLEIDSKNANLGKLNATRRVARTIYLGSAPSTSGAQRGIEDRRVKLGCVMPGESPAIFGDALRRLASQATFLYTEGPRAWYDTQPTVTKLADDYAEQYKREPDRVFAELDKRIRAGLTNTGDFSRVHPLPRTGAEVPDDLDARLVVLAPDQPYSKVGDCPAEVAAKEILESRGTGPRLFRNTLVFLAADKVRMQDLDEAVRRFLAWDTIVNDTTVLNLDPQQVRQASEQRKTANDRVNAQLPETYQWLLVPGQKDASSPIVWTPTKLTAGDTLAARASKRLRADEALVLNLGSSVLRDEMKKVPLWRGNHVPVKTLVADFATFLYLPRLAGPEVLLRAIRDGVGMLTWATDTFALAESYDEGAGRYRGLRAKQLVTLSLDSSDLIVKSSVAKPQIDAELAAASSMGGAGTAGLPGGEGIPGIAGGLFGGTGGTTAPAATGPVAPKLPKRYYGTVELNAQRVGRDASEIANELIAHLVGLDGAEVRVTMEIEANLPNGATEQIVRIVTENGKQLKFKSQGFEAE